MADRVWKVVYTQVFGCSHQLSLSKFFDTSTPSMRKLDNGGKLGEGTKGNNFVYCGHERCCQSNVLTLTDWNDDHLCQKVGKRKNWEKKSRMEKRGIFEKKENCGQKGT